ncbi:MAG: SoxR reducing system RseC family protein [Nitrospirae bacterium]|nr:SoxR reducing system RseC family protein [Nitrospirota bacterium]
MEEVGIVKSIDGVTAKVLVERKSACDKCSEGLCHVSDAGALIDALNIAKAKEGQKVKVVFKSYTYLKGTILIYGLPALALIIGAVLGKEFLPRIFSGVDPDLLSAVGGFGLFILTFIAARLFSLRMEKNTEYKPVVEEILE